MKRKTINAHSGSLSGTASYVHKALIPLGVMSLGMMSLPVLAQSPTTPGTPTGSVSNQSVELQWEPSEDDNQVAGYNLYLNDEYYKTVFDNRFAGALDTSQKNELYITAFDEPLAGEERAYSERSGSIVFDRVEVSVTDPENPGEGKEENDTTRPLPPSSLILVSALSSAVTISWSGASDNVGVVGYNVYRQGNYVTTVFDTQYVDNNPLMDTDNTYSVVAFDAARNYSILSAELSILVPSSPTEPEVPGEKPETPDPTVTPDPAEDDTTAPSIPDGLNVTSSTSESVLLSWNAAEDNVGVDGYNVYRDGNYITTVFTTQYNDAAPAEGATVAYSVAAFDEARNFSPLSEELSVTGSETPPTETPEPGTPDPGTPEPPETPEGPTLTPGEMVPVLDPSNRFPSPDPDDPFGSQLEVDNEVPVPGGPPTTPKNLRIDLVSNNWAEFSWAPANDDVGVVAYNISRDDGVTFVISPDQSDPNGGAQAEIDKYWATTSFIDCNFTRFDTRVYNCRANQPVPGETYVYQVSAVDGDGQESPQSAPLSITYHLLENAPVPIFDDFFKMPEDRFAQSNDLSETRFFLDEFDLVFNDEFDGTSLDPTKWQTELTFGDSFIVNGEQQYFVRTQNDPEFGYDPFTFDGEALTINAIPTPDDLQDNLPPVCDEIDSTGNERCLFLSGALSSHDRFGFLYGYVEGRMKTSPTSGALASFFLFNRFPGSGVNLHAPEIDILEYLGENPFGDEDAFQTYHYRDVNTEITRSAPTMSFANPDGELYSDRFHTYGVLWEPQLVIWYIDGKEIKRMTGPMVSRQPMNIVNYLVAGSAWAPTPDVSRAEDFPLQFNVDYIRVYQREAYQGTASFGP